MMNRFGKVIVAVLILAGVALATMIRFTDAPGAGQVVGPAAAPTAAIIGGPAGLAIPVAGVKPEALTDTFADARTGHFHGASDIPAALGTPVIAAASGTIEKIFESADGGHTVYVRSPNGRWAYYYAHLDRYAPGLAEGLSVRRGAPIGTVGFSGNANPAGPHLHFAIKAMSAGDSWYQGRPINPYPLLSGH